MLSSRKYRANAWHIFWPIYLKTYYSHTKTKEYLLSVLFSFAYPLSVCIVFIVIVSCIAMYYITATHRLICIVMYYYVFILKPHMDCYELLCIYITATHRLLCSVRYYYVFILQPHMDCYQEEIFAPVLVSL